MLTKNEVNALKLSPTKKDFVQIWNELLDVAGKLSERWDPTSTNESDPGIVILKALTGIADKLNYNIDKNTLEAFMPTAAQEDSMRKLCEMLGYNVKYYQSATTTVNIKYHNSEPETAEKEATTGGAFLEIPKFTVLSNSDDDINYFTVKAAYISAENPLKAVDCLEGQLVKCESYNDNCVITAQQISENNRFYLPEVQVAENGIFIYNVVSASDLSLTGTSSSEAVYDGARWEQVSNLNVQPKGSCVYKFGFDSYASRPYVEFPDDYRELFNHGIFIYYTRTSGLAGNVAAGTLTKIELPTTGVWQNINTDSFGVEHQVAATNGANVETIQQAYNNFKKTIGTFETLVTCRDYMNKIYSMVDDTNKNFVSNILVTDIRDDINRSTIICSCDDSGIYYKETPIKIGSNTTNSEPSTPVLVSTIAPTYSLVGDESDYEYETVESITSTPLQVAEDTSEKQKISDTETTEYVVAEVNKPRYDSNGVVVTLDTGTRSTNWFIGADSSIPVFADGHPGSFITNSAFNEQAEGEVLSDNADGTPSDYWLVVQDGTTYTTNLPITRIPSTTRTIVEEQVTTRTNEVTTTISQQRTLRERGTEVNNYTATTTNTVEDSYAIDHFDLVFYPFKRYNQIKNNVKSIKTVYESSFSLLGRQNILFDYVNNLDNKTIAHNIVTPRTYREVSTYASHGDIISINNYLRLSATIATTTKITIDEGNLLIENIKIALANAFNMRELDFGEEIPFDSIVKVIENADTRIRVASLNEPALFTTYSVLTDYDKYGNPVVEEYAVASSWLDLEEATKMGRFHIGDEKHESTFNTKEAKEIYNRLAVRNVLAGRVALFNYNKTFNTGFYEGVYKKTVLLDQPYEAMPAPTKDNPVTYAYENGVLYTGKWEKQDTDVDGNDIFGPNYYSTSADVNYLAGAITRIPGEKGASHNITSIEAKCEISPASDTDRNKHQITNVELGPGEFIKFRAPNFTTVKTYPAYVNYRLELQSNSKARAAEEAQASSLFELLNEDRQLWSTTANYVTRWQKVLNFFGDAKKTFKLKQTISGYTPAISGADDVCSATDGAHTPDSNGRCIGCGAQLVGSMQKGDITISVDTADGVTEMSPDDYLALSGCVKIAGGKQIENNKPGEAAKYKYKVTPELKYTAAPGGPDLPLALELDNPFIIDSGDFAAIKEAIDTKLGELLTLGELTAITKEWMLTLSCECVPFDATTLARWENMVKQNPESLFDFTPARDNSTVLWRVYESGGYAAARFILPSKDKLMPFSGNYFTSLPINRLTGIYVAKSLGKDAILKSIPNDSEYQLTGGEKLYIEYTPSSVSEDGTTQEGKPVTAVYGSGTIIRPSGFETSLTDSGDYSTEHTPHKQITFDGEHSPKELFSLGANEQIEIRDFAKVELKKGSFKSSSVIYVYKNFSCPTLSTVGSGGGDRKYTLKDGEYVFYTDANKSEMAYFGSGTEVTLKNNLIIPDAEIIDIATVLDNGMQVIPWSALRFLSTNDALIFTEYQYRTLGQGDTLNKIQFSDTETEIMLNESWRECSGVEYIVAGAEDDDISTLPEIDVSNYGWEACSFLELNVSTNHAQTLRHDASVNTSLVLLPKGSSNSAAPKQKIELAQGDPPLCFKTNVPINTSAGAVSIDDIYTKSSAISNFEFKIFAEDAPAIIETAPGSLLPSKKSTDGNYWVSTELSAAQDLWTSVDMNELKPEQKDKGKYDLALKLPVTVLPNTYGVFTILLNYLGIDASDNVETRLYCLPAIPDAVSSITEPAVCMLNGENQTLNLAEGILLTNGINSIRVNQMCTLIIKVTDNAKGMLFFDELKLVNYEELEYTDPIQGDPVTAKTMGLNIEQLGYLHPDVTTTDMRLTVATKNSLKQDKLTTFADKLYQLNTGASTEFMQMYADLAPCKSKLEPIYKLASEAKTRLETLSKQHDDDYIQKLVDDTRSLLASLQEKEALLNVLTPANNTDLAAILQQLNSLLNTIATTEATEQKLFTELKTAKELVTTSAKTLDNNIVIQDFKDVCINDNGYVAKLADTEKFVIELLSKLKTALMALQDADYASQLASITEAANNTINSADRAAVVSMLDQLREEKNSADKTELALLLSQLNNATDGAELNNLIIEVKQAADALDYSALETALTRLRNYLASTERTVLLSEINAAAEKADYIHLADLIASLDDLVASDNECIALIDKVLTALFTLNVNAGPLIEENISQVTSELAALLKAIEEDYFTKQTEIIEELSAKVTLLKDEDGTPSLEEANGNQIGTDIKFSTVMRALSTAKDAQTIKLAGQLSALHEAYKQARDDISTLTKFKDVLDLPFADEAISSVWLPYMYRSGYDNCADIYNIITDNYDAVYKILAEHNIEGTQCTFELQNRKMLIKVADIATFKALDAQARKLVQTINKNNENLAIIKTLITTILKSNKSVVNLINAADNTRAPAWQQMVGGMLAKLVPLNTDENAVAAYNALTAAEVNDLLRGAAEELSTLVLEDEGLYETLATMLCKPILLPEKAFIGLDLADDFYDGYNSIIKNLQESLLAAKSTNDRSRKDIVIQGAAPQGIALCGIMVDLANIIDIVGGLLEELAASNLESFTEWLIGHEDRLGVMLPIGKYQDILADGTEAAKLLKAIKRAFVIFDGFYPDFIKAVASEGNTITGDRLIALFSELTIGHAGDDDPTKAVVDLILTLTEAFHKIEEAEEISSNYSDEYLRLKTEEILLADIRRLDYEKSFYYTAPIDTTLAIEFNERNSELNTLMNPRFNYDINNVNNNFVISKLDIDYLTDGLQLARSSRLN